MTSPQKARAKVIMCKGLHSFILYRRTICMELRPDRFSEVWADKFAHFLPIFYMGKKQALYISNFYNFGNTFLLLI